ncbi:MAG: hypothetical protein JO256_11355 [Alphaproteobacteria bacterium]|nr:hypothetical protein [Alphaproteobacteria bacterium]
MSEDTDAPESGSPDTNGLALDLAMEEARNNSALHGDVAAFLRDQRSLIATQKHHLQEQFKAMRLGLWEKRLGVLLRVSTAAVGLAFAAGIAWQVWDAAQSNRLLIEPFSLPPDLAVRGLTGDVVAAKLLDRIVAMQAQTNSQRAAKSLTNSWTQDDIKLDIPETGLSLGQLDSFLREKLGHDTHVRGEIVRMANGLELTARAGTDGAESVSGAEADLDGLVQKLSEAIYKLTQPYRYAVWLGTHGSVPEATAIFRTLQRTGSEQDRIWGTVGEGTMITEIAGLGVSRSLWLRAEKLDPNNVVVVGGLAFLRTLQGQNEAALRGYKLAVALPQTHSQETVRADVIPMVVMANQAAVDMLLGDYRKAAGEQIIAVEKGVPGRYGMTALLAIMFAQNHDLKAAAASWSEYPERLSLAPGNTALYKIRAESVISSRRDDWAGVLADQKGLLALYAVYPGMRSIAPTMIAPLAAVAQARLGHFAEAEATIAPTPGDCYECLIARAQIAELRGQQERADWWFARAMAAGPSLPQAEQEWGRVLLARGKPDDATAQFVAANKKGPHFADALEGWGEALMAKNQSHLGLAKLAEAEKYAPNWGRLHLKWGEALVYAGKRAEAKAQFARATQLDLTPSEKAELARTQR